MTDEEVLIALAAQLRPRGTTEVVALRPVLYLNHPFVKQATECLRKRLLSVESGVDKFNDLEILAVIVLCEAAGIEKS